MSVSPSNPSILSSPFSSPSSPASTGHPAAVFPDQPPWSPAAPPAHLSSAHPVGFHAASLFPSSHPKCSPDSKLKSGLDRTVAPSATIYVLWPHEAFDHVSDQRDYKHYGDLSVGALAAGMVRSLLYLPEFASIPTNIQMQLQHMSILFDSIVVTNNLKAALEFQKSILLMLERGQLQWEPQFAPSCSSCRLSTWQQTARSPL